MSRKKNERPQSALEFEAAAEKICRCVYEDTKYNFGIKDKPDEVDDEGNIIKRGSKKYTNNKDYIELTKTQMLTYADMIDYYVQAADSHYPRNMEILIERRTMQDNAIGACRTLKRRYQINLDNLGVPRGKYSETIKLIDHEIAVIQGWRKSDNKWEDKFKEDIEEF